MLDSDGYYNTFYYKPPGVEEQICKQWVLDQTVSSYFDYLLAFVLTLYMCLMKSLYNIIVSKLGFWERELES